MTLDEVRANGWARGSLDRLRAHFADRSRRDDLVRCIAVYLVTRAGLALFVWLTGQYFTFQGPRFHDPNLVPDNYVLNAMFHWDAVHYYEITTRGYFVGAGFDTTAPYFPGFPLGAMSVGRLFGSVLVGGIVLNHAASILGAFLLARLVRHLGVCDRGGRLDDTARDASVFWLASPLTFFFCVYLSESLFACASVAMLWAVASGRWRIAMLAGIAATATRNAGVIVVLSATMLAWERRRRVRVGPQGWVCLALAPMGLAMFVLYQHHKLGNGFAWVDAQTAWGRGLVPPWTTLKDDWWGMPSLAERNVDKMYRAQELLALTLVAPLLLLPKRLEIPWSIWLLGVGEWLLPVCSHSLISIARYQSGNVYFALAIPAVLASRPTARNIAAVFFGMVLAWYASTYAFGNWAS